MNKKVAEYLMLARWWICFPCAFVTSFISWGIISGVFSTVTYDRMHFWRCLLGVTPLFIKDLTSAVVFILTGVVSSPSKERRVCFVFFALSLLCSGANADLMSFGDPHRPDDIFWATSCLGIVAGAILGLAIALRLQALRKKRVMRSIQPASTSPEDSAQL